MASEKACIWRRQLSAWQSRDVGAGAGVVTAAEVVLDLVSEEDVVGWKKQELADEVAVTSPAQLPMASGRPMV